MRKEVVCMTCSFRVVVNFKPFGLKWLIAICPKCLEIAAMRKRDNSSR